MRVPLVSMSATSSRMLSCARSRSREERRILCVDCCFDVGARYHAAAGLPGPKIGLGKHVIELVDDQRELVGMIGQPGGVLDQSERCRRDRPA